MKAHHLRPTILIDKVIDLGPQTMAHEQNIFNLLF